MAKEVSLKIVADASKATEEAKGLKQQLRDATKEAQKLAASGKTNTEEYRKARNQVAELQDQMRDFNDELKALDPGQKFQAIAGVATGIAGGFQAAQGAMALFGKESEDVQKALLKVQGAMALAQGIDQVRELGKYFSLAKTAIMGGVSSLGKMRAALIATGVGAFAVAIGTIAANWEELSKWIDKTFPKLGGVANIFDNIKKAAMGSLNVIIEYFKAVGDMMVQLWSGEWSNLVDTAKNLGSRLSKAYTEGYVKEEENQAKEREAKLLEKTIKAHEREVKLLEAQGKDSYALKKKQLEEQLRLVEIQKKKESEEYKDAFLELQLLEIEHNKKIQEERKKHQDWQKQHQHQAILDKQQAEADLTAIADKMLEDEIKKNEERLKNQIETDKSIAESSHKLAQAEIKAEMEADQARIDAYNSEQAIKAARLQAAADITNGLTALGNAFIKDQKKLEKFNKASALVQIGIDTAKAISALVAASNANPANAVTFGGAGIAQFASGITQILLNIAKAKQILSSSSSGSSTPTLGGGGGVASAGGGNMPQTNAPGGFTSDVSGQRVANQTGEGANQQGQFKVYVLESDITSTQDGVAGIKRKAKVM